MGMGNDFLSSSDSNRAARPLPYARTVNFPEGMDLELGGRLDEVTVCYETYGELTPQADNAVLICHALSGDSHVARHEEADDAGWWETIVGPGKPIDTEQYFVICPNVLGGCRGTTGPNCINPVTGKPYGQDFPNITICDMVSLQKKLVDYLGVEKLLAVTGGSMGGQMVLCWAAIYPEASRAYIPIATAARLTSQSLAFDIVGRNAILHDPSFRDGQYYGHPQGPDIGLAIARMIGHITYLSRESMQLKFETDRHSPREVSTAFEKRFSVGSYLGYQGDRFVERFDANSYITLTMAMDLFDLGDNREALAKTIGATEGRWLILSYTSDWLFPPEESRLLTEALIRSGTRVSYCNVPSPYGHDSFLLEHNLEIYGELIRAFLANANGITIQEPAEAVSNSNTGSDTVSAPATGGRKQATVDPASIFHPDRLDYDRIIDLIPPGSSVLDLGCGHGELLYRLKQRGFEKLTGVELDEEAIVSCSRLGLDVLYLDLNQHLDPFLDGSYDYVVLSRTLQAVLDVEGLLAEIVRIGRRGIVSFPNFAYGKLRRMLFEQGRAPESEGVLRYKWYNTPNRRFFSIADFEDLCRERTIQVHRRVALDTEAQGEVVENPNYNADLAIFVISR
ncbi:MAG: homoserine O-acetyltransferase [Spirochaetaceae bacterium]|nr:MAG: homoserine O-acetyltransferase [Spirochaetaceae bacterium]